MLYPQATLYCEAHRKISRVQKNAVILMKKNNFCKLPEAARSL